MSHTRDETATHSAQALGLVVFFVVVIVVGIWLTAQSWLPPLASRHGAGIDRMIHYLLVTVGILFVGGHLVLLSFIWQARRRKSSSKRRPSLKTETLLSVIAVILMALITEGGVSILGLPVWEELYRTEPPGNAVTVEVTGQQFEWQIRYPGTDGAFGRTDSALIDANNPLGLDRTDPAAGDDILLRNRFYLPVNRPARIRLRSRDMLHSFFLPHFRIKQDLVPGMLIETWFVPTKEGTYELACAELCGLGHYRMRGFVEVLSDEDFRAQMSADEQGQ